jgi:glutamine cyclotransferase
MNQKKFIWSLSVITIIASVLYFTLFYKKDGYVDNSSIRSIKTKKNQYIEYTIGDIFTHNPKLFTQGLVFYNGFMFESTGAPDHIPYTETLIVKKDLKTDKDTVVISLKKSVFGEGITILNDKIYQLTYRNKNGYVYDLNSYKKVNTFTIKTDEGWGITNDGEFLILSDGSDILSFVDPESFEYISELEVKDNGSPLKNINELEYINGYIYANIWFTNYIVKIDTKSGDVVGKIDLTDLCNKIKQYYPESNTLNGIAYDQQSKKVYITGKLWPHIYEIKFCF